jgi:hypothetical protein
LQSLGFWLAWSGSAIRTTIANWAQLMLWWRVQSYLLHEWKLPHS